MNTNWDGKNISVDVLYSQAGIATQILLKDKVNDEYLLLDCGDGTIRDLLDRSINLQKLKGIAISHGHMDHIAGLLSVLFVLHLMKYQGEFIIIGPSPCDEAHTLIKYFLNFYKEKLSFTLNYHELKESVNECIGNFLIKPFQANHYPSKQAVEKMPAFGYKITIEDEVVIYSGDTMESDQLEKEVEGVDLAILEATFKSTDKRDLFNHLTVEYAEYIGKLAKNFIFVHPFPTFPH